MKAPNCGIINSSLSQLWHLLGNVEWERHPLFKDSGHCLMILNKIKNPNKQPISTNVLPEGVVFSCLSSLLQNCWYAGKWSWLAANSEVWGVWRMLGLTGSLLPMEMVFFKCCVRTGWDPNPENPGSRFGFSLLTLRLVKRRGCPVPFVQNGSLSQEMHG